MTVQEVISPVLVQLGPALFEGRSFVAHITRCRVYTSPREMRRNNVPNPLDLAEVADEEAEEIGEGEFEVNSTLPIRFEKPQSLIKDLPKKRAGGHPQTKEDPVEMEEPPQMDEEDPREGTSHQRDPLEESLPPMPRTEPQKRKAPEGGIRTKIMKWYREGSFSDEEAPRSKSSVRWKELVVESDYPGMTSEEDESISSLQVKTSMDSELPTKGTPGSAGHDVRLSKNYTIPAHGIIKCDLKLRVQLPANYCMMLLGRSGLAAQGIIVHTGQIDEDYRGQISAIVHNSTDGPVQVAKGQRIAQALILSLIAATWTRAVNLSSTTQDGKEFGHTGSN